jgi:hypothetical protein
VFELSQKINMMAVSNLERDKIDAFEIAHREYAPSSLFEQYERLWK